MFRGETLRGLLLNAFAFWKMGQIAMIAAIAAFAGAGVLLLLSGLGFWHLRRTDPSAELLPKLGARTPANIEV
jgi:cytochrome oxidase assembly protein ShyY1